MRRWCSILLSIMLAVAQSAPVLSAPPDPHAGCPCCGETCDCETACPCQSTPTTRDTNPAPASTLPAPKARLVTRRQSVTPRGMFVRDHRANFEAALRPVLLTSMFIPRAAPARAALGIWTT